MGTTFESLLPDHEQFIKEQRIFFVGSAASTGHVNISPKGHDVFRILSPNKVAYLDLTGSGNETSAHITESSRLTFMFISFEGKPLILRLYGNGRVVLPNTDEWNKLVPNFDLLPGYRQIIVSEIEIVKTSCGYSVPLYSFEGERDVLLKWAVNKGEENLIQYRKNKNSISMDGIVTPIGVSLIEDE
ncbi:pyridoxamine 5'-phosphate oxidase [Paenibacillus cellulosilyticus]|uniref:Pyridoxamine 5'-phosphate oxidase n=1 Tax=Paenibacillus cellulosilyticus TaxID=375489 RepID=A0A2V2YLJ8_9BACL|nr:pyridoxamine 5'-phosphate oxidase family protein [Paenibacillus cellulosilyticus]PWV94446.1 pyridoxamine 5'-phosphate oxidase [Paenibacillus cellulosilyticus]QKS44967.1 pyridoxamine 5'-phosphate oxidase family protein [Paenibacillus cellulosilyticus]